MRPICASVYSEKPAYTSAIFDILCGSVVICPKTDSSDSEEP